MDFITISSSSETYQTRDSVVLIPRRTQFLQTLFLTNNLVRAIRINQCHSPCAPSDAPEACILVACTAGRRKASSYVCSLYPLCRPRLNLTWAVAGLTLNSELSGLASQIPLT